MSRVAVAAVALGVTAAMAACGRIARHVRLVADPPARLEELWQETMRMWQGSRRRSPKA
jgi:hypothetical protein